MKSRWTEADIPDQSDRTVLITGANSGLGLQSAKALANRGAHVLLGCRSRERGEQAVRAVGGGTLVALDLADLDSVRRAATAVRELTGDRLDVLMNNAGVLAPPRARTQDGFESQFGINHLGHAALTWLLMPALRGAGHARVVTLSSMVARGACLDLNDPNFERQRYHASVAYSRSKLANQVFAMELDRRLRTADETVVSVAAHPGYAKRPAFFPRWVIRTPARCCGRRSRPRTCSRGVYQSPRTCAGAPFSSSSPRPRPQSTAATTSARPASASSAAVPRS